jgi:type II secretory pathway predicted ATPase ExeA
VPVYERFYGLRERPFDLTPNPRFVFLTAKHQEALANLQYGISDRKGVTVLIGPAGGGKTTLIRTALANLRRQNAECVVLSNPTLRRDEFLETLAAGFNLTAQAAHSKAALLAELEPYLQARLAAGVATALIVDEAQALSPELLEEVRLLVNLETETHKLLPVVLVGQDELSDRLAHPSCTALKQRVALRCYLPPLNAAETAHYVATRLRTAGGNPGQAFTREAIEVIHQYSGGAPRVISVICDNAMLAGFAAEQRPVGRQLVMEVCRDYDLQLTATAPALEPDVSEPVTIVEHREPPAAAPAPILAPPPAAVQAPGSAAAAAGDEDGRMFATFGRPGRSWFSR